MVLKGDSCLLNGRKPMFIPDNTHELGATPCIILRVSRLGKEIDTRFAERYYDAVAPGMDFAALDVWHEAEASGHSWTEAIAFDYSLVIGEWIDKNDWQPENLILTPAEAIAKASKLMTIRQGDLIYIQTKTSPQIVQKEQILRIEIKGEEKLYCKIK